MKDRIVSSIQSRFPEREEGQGMVEYGLIIALVAVVAIAGLIIMGPKVAALFTALGTSV
jgi:pilus assembly protein Flp/PilA